MVESFTVLGTKVRGSYSLIDVGSGFHCLRSFFYSIFLSGGNMASAGLFLQSTKSINFRFVCTFMQSTC